MCQPVELGRFELRPCRCTSHCATAREISQRHRRGKFSGKSVRIAGNPVNFHPQGRKLAVIDLIGEPYMLVMSALTSSSKSGTSQRHPRHLYSCHALSLSNHHPPSSYSLFPPRVFAAYCTPGAASARLPRREPRTDPD